MTSSNNKVVTDVCKCGHERSYHNMTGPCYFCRIDPSTDENTTPVSTPARNEECNDDAFFSVSAND